MAKIQFQYVDTQDKLQKAAAQWSTAQHIGVDVECENNLHHYGSYVSIIQLSTKDLNWIVDVLKLKSIKPVLDMFLDNSVEKIFHDVGFDLRIIHHEFKVCPVNLFDTEIAALLLGKKEYGLGSLLSEYFGVKKASKFQMADWSRRPLKPDMLEYAASDSSYLVPLRNKLAKELKSAGRLAWAEEEFAHLEKKCWDLKVPTFFDLKGIKQLTPAQRGVAKNLFELRESIAKSVNKPVHYIFKNASLIDFARNPPKGISFWKALKGVHPIVRKMADDFKKAVDEGESKPIILPVGTRKRLTAQQKTEFEALSEVQALASKKTGIAGSVIVSKDQMREIVVTGRTTCLRNWQADLLEKTLDSPKLELSGSS